MARSTVDACPLDRVRVAPGRLVVNGEHYSYDDCTFTIEEVGERHFVIVCHESSGVPIEPTPSRWRRLLDWRHA